MRDDLDGDKAMVPRMPNLPPQPSARQIVEHELTGTCSVQKLVPSLRCVEGSSACAFFTRKKESCLKSAPIMASLVVTEKMCCQSCVSSVGTVQPDAWERQLLTGRERQITRFISDSIHEKFGIQENSGEIRQLTIIVEFDRTCDMQFDGCGVGADDVSRRRS